MLFKHSNETRNKICSSSFRLPNQDRGSDSGVAGRSDFERVNFFNFKTKIAAYQSNLAISTLPMRFVRTYVCRVSLLALCALLLVFCYVFLLLRPNAWRHNSIKFVIKINSNVIISVFVRFVLFLFDAHSTVDYLFLI